MNIRQACQRDAAILGKLIFCSASNTLAATFTINETLSAQNFLRMCLLYPAGQYGYQNHWVAEIDNQVVGCLSVWKSDLPDSFHEATLAGVSAFYGIEHALCVLLASHTLQDCIPKPQQHELCIGHFAVLQQYQRLGVGNALLRLAHEKALVCGKSALSLDVESANSRAIEFYLGQGFIKVSESDISPRMQSLGVDRHLHMSKVF